MLFVCYDNNSFVVRLGSTQRDFSCHISHSFSTDHRLQAGELLRWKRAMFERFSSTVIQAAEGVGGGNDQIK
jgi:hypothetical protein